MDVSGVRRARKELLVRPCTSFSRPSIFSLLTSTTSTFSIESLNMGIFDTSLFSSTLRSSTLSASSIYIPRLTTYYETGKSPVKHIQTWCTWKRLSSSQADELVTAELAFNDAIQEKILTYADAFRASSWPPRDGICTIKVNIAELAITITEACFGTCDSPTILTLPNMVQFVRLHDIFMLPASARAPDQTGIRNAASTVQADEARIEFSMPACAPPAIATHPPRIVIEDLIVYVEPGQNYYLTPRYITEFSKSSEFFPEVTYNTTCNWLRYNEAESRFEGAIPTAQRPPGSIIAPHSDTIVIKAVAVHNFQGTNVRYEETVQVSVTLLVSNRPIPPVKQVRFVDAWGARPRHEIENSLALRSHNSFSVLEDCTNMDQIKPELMAPADSSDESTGHSSPSDISMTTYCASDRELDNKDLLCSALKVDPPTRHSIERSNASSDESKGSSSFSNTSKSKSTAASLSSHEGPAYSSSSDKITVPPFRSAAYPPGAEIVMEMSGMELRETVRQIGNMDFDEDEDPRDVREMKKALLDIAKKGMEESMLGYRVDRWSNDS